MALTVSRASQNLELVTAGRHLQFILILKVVPPPHPPREILSKHDPLMRVSGSL